jgi:Mg2+ and Co2+ transporter CorA
MANKSVRTLQEDILLTIHDKVMNQVHHLDRDNMRLKETAESTGPVVKNLLEREKEYLREVERLKLTVTRLSTDLEDSSKFKAEFNTLKDEKEKVKATFYRMYAAHNFS